MSDGIRRYETGSIRSSDCDDVRYDCISPHGLYRLAKRYALGAKKYGDHNHLLGQPISEVFNHMFDHMRKYLAGDKSEDNMAAIAWGAFTIMEYEESNPTMQNMPRHNPECWPKPRVVEEPVHQVDALKAWADRQIAAGDGCIEPEGVYHKHKESDK